MERTTTAELRVLIVQDGDWWVLRGVDHDIVGCAESLEDAFHDFERVLASHIILDLREGREPLSAIPPAPPEEQVAWERAVAQAQPLRPWELPPKAPSLNVRIAA